jgi:predicted ATPase
MARMHRDDTRHSARAARVSITRRRFRPRAQGATPGTEAGQGRVRRIVLTGGTGGGKSTAAAFLAREFTDACWVLPEAATVLYRGGMPRGDSPLGVQIAQRSIFALQRSLEQACSVQHPDRVQLCDRAGIDGAAYWPEGPEAFFAAMGTTHEAELARYDAVIFLHTAAKLPAGYERDLDIRVEDQAAALELDARNFDLYASHPRLIRIEATGSFLAKLTAVHEAVRSLLVGEVPTVDVAPARPQVPLSAMANLGAFDHLLP